LVPDGIAPSPEKRTEIVNQATREDNVLQPVMETELDVNQGMDQPTIDDVPPVEDLHLCVTGIKTAWTTCRRMVRI